MQKKVLLLTQSEVARLIDMPSAIKVVKKAFCFHGKNLVQMPAKIYLHLDKFSGDFRAMPVYIEGMSTCGLKWVNVYPQNRRFGLPAVTALIILNDLKTGLALSIMDGTLITNLRTGAAGAVAAKYLARADSSVVGLVGCGAQAKTQLLALKEMFRIKSVYLWGNKIEYARKFLKDTQSFGLPMEIKKNIYDCVKDADIVVTTTPVRKPIVKAQWIKKGTHINAIGADAKGKEELEPALLKKAKIIVDDLSQALHSGEVNVPISRKIISSKDIYATLGEVLIGRKKGRTSPDDITIFDSTGLAIQDLVVADLVFRRAKKKKVGKYFGIMD